MSTKTRKSSKLTLDQSIELLEEMAKKSSRKNADAAIEVIKEELLAKRLKARRGSITFTMYQLFDQNGVDNVTLDQAQKAAREVKPDTSFDKTHLAYHKSNYRKIRGITEIAPAATGK